MVVCFVLVVVVGKRGQVFGDRSPDRVETHHVTAVHGGYAVGLRSGELQSVGLAQNRRQRIRNSTAPVNRLEHRLGRLVSRPGAPAIELLGERLPLARRSEVEAHHSSYSDRRSYSRERRLGRAESLIHIVAVPLRLRVESAHGEQRWIGKRELS